MRRTMTVDGSSDAKDLMMSVVILGMRACLNPSRRQQCKIKILVGKLTSWNRPKSGDLWLCSVGPVMTIDQITEKNI